MFESILGFKIEFEWWFLFSLLPLPLLVYWFIPSRKQNDSAIIMPFINIEDINHTKSNYSVLKNYNLWLLLFAWLALILAVSRPIWVGDLVKLPQEGKDVILAVDLSGSMQERDFSYAGRRLNRLDVVKIAANEFIEKRHKDRIGLIVFGSQAYLYAPLTFDTKLIKQFLKESQIRMAGEKTAIGDAIAMAIKHFREVNKKNSKKEKILVLLTDGANSAGVITPNKAIQLAKLENIKIYTIGLGSNSRSWFRRSSIDIGLLKRIASSTGGQFFHATNTRNLQKIYTALDKLETSKEKAKSFRPKKDLFYYPLSAFFALTLLIALFRLKQ
ncbi:BatA (Bacteroides aerotolerance operon) [hydrothermal vent metagenome]|uniref:BatA (Bacteroides aerotolerance operon) n=1 Tax=hydrothermal vent metagenome TaxID=652676 RepID=A0A1W1CD69_9ZZZZ